MNFEEWLLKAEGLFSNEEKNGKTLSELPDTFILKRPLMHSITSTHYEHMQLKKYRGILLKGNEGCGRHTLMNAYIQSLCSTYVGFEMVRLRSEDFTDEAIKSDEDAISFVDALYEYTKKSKTMGIIVFDQMETYKRLGLICNRIAENVTDEDYGKAFTICISTEEAKIPQELLSVLLNCRCPLPSKISRRKFFENNLSWDVPDWKNEREIHTFSIGFDGISKDELAEKTAGFSYAELTDFLTYIKMDVSGNNLENLPSNSFLISREKCEEYLSISHFANETPSGTVIIQEQLSSASGTAKRNRDDLKGTMEKLDSKGGNRTFEEDLFSIDNVATLDEE